MKILMKIMLKRIHTIDFDGEDCISLLILELAKFGVFSRASLEVYIDSLDVHLVQARST